MAQQRLVGWNNSPPKQRIHKQANTYIWRWAFGDELRPFFWCLVHFGGCGGLSPNDSRRSLGGSPAGDLRKDHCHCWICFLVKNKVSESEEERAREVRWREVGREGDRELELGKFVVCFSLFTIFGCLSRRIPCPVDGSTASTEYDILLMDRWEDEEIRVPSPPFTIGKWSSIFEGTLMQTYCRVGIKW